MGHTFKNATSFVTPKKPRILMLMTGWDQHYLESIHRDRSPYEFVKYTGFFSPDAVKEFLTKHHDEYDAVAVYGIGDYEVARTAMEEAWNGPKILLDSTGRPQNLSGDYLFKVGIPVRPSEFDRLIIHHFEKIAPLR